jgi:hypothetical protein
MLFSFCFNIVLIIVICWLLFWEIDFCYEVWNRGN